MSLEIAEYRSEFSVFVVDAAFQQAEPLLETLKNVGYNVQYYPTADSALVAAQANPPHMVLLNFDGFGDGAESLLSGFHEVSEEIHSILLVTAKSVLPALQAISRGLAYDKVLNPPVSPLEIVQALDRAASQLFFQFESEQLNEQLREGPARSAEPVDTPAPHSDEAPASVAAPVAPPQASPPVPSMPVEPLHDFVMSLEGMKELDTLVQVFMDIISGELRNTPILYFKYLPHYASLLASKSVWLPMDKLRGVGFNLKNESPDQVAAFLRDPGSMPQLRELMKNVFKKTDYFALPHLGDHEPYGIFVVFEPLLNSVQRQKIELLRGIFEITYGRNVLLKDKHTLEVFDPLTQLTNRKHFMARLDEEISRSRRTSLPLAIVVLDIDNFAELNDEIGTSAGDGIIKGIAGIMKKTSRNTDILARLSGDDLVLLLPHTDRMGAAVKAERIRRIIEATKFPAMDHFPDRKVTISAGVSEYPSFCNDATGLLRSADEALFQVKASGGNRVCMATAPEGFVADFEPQVIKDTHKERS